MLGEGVIYDIQGEGGDWQTNCHRDFVYILNAVRLLELKSLVWKQDTFYSI